MLHWNCISFFRPSCLGLWFNGYSAYSMHHVGSIPQIFFFFILSFKFSSASLYPDRKLYLICVTCATYSLHILENSIILLMAYTNKDLYCSSSNIVSGYQFYESITITGTLLWLLYPFLKGYLLLFPLFLIVAAFLI